MKILIPALFVALVMMLNTSIEVGGQDYGGGGGGGGYSGGSQDYSSMGGGGSAYPQQSPVTGGNDGELGTIGAVGGILGLGALGYMYKNRKRRPGVNPSVNGMHPQYPHEFQPGPHSVEHPNPRQEIFVHQYNVPLNKTHEGHNPTVHHEPARHEPARHEPASHEPAHHEPAHHESPNHHPVHATPHHEVPHRPRVDLTHNEHVGFQEHRPAPVHHSNHGLSYNEHVGKK